MPESVKAWFAQRRAENPELQAEYDRLAPRFKAIRELIRARTEAGLSQAALARQMGVKQPVIARLESGENSPKLDTLAAAAAALGCELEVRFKPVARPPGSDEPAQAPRARTARRTKATVS